MSAIDRLLVKLAYVKVPGHTRVQNGKVVHVSGYSYMRVAIRQEGHARGWDVEGGSAFKQLPSGHVMQVSPERAKKIGTLVRSSLTDGNGRELYHTVHRDPVQAFTTIEQMSAAFLGLGRFPTKKGPQRDLAEAASAAFPHKTTEEVRELLRKAPTPKGPARFRRSKSYR